MFSRTPSLSSCISKHHHHLISPPSPYHLPQIIHHSLTFASRNYIARHYDPKVSEGKYLPMQLRHLERLSHDASLAAAGRHQQQQQNEDSHNNTHLSNSINRSHFSIMLPPPNITGRLHIGHALTLSIQDSLTRYHSLSYLKYPSIYIPGMDHAGISTQVVVEKKLAREGRYRADMERHQFLEEMKLWEKTYREAIRDQINEMGALCDWNREVFTMDPQRELAVREAFIRLHTDGLIYRAKRLVNWCCTLQTAISDIEVESMQISKPTELYVPSVKRKVTFGLMHHFKYPLLVEGEGEASTNHLHRASKDEFIQVSTTRIETMPGDTAIAVHSQDERYLKYHGRYCVHPISGRKIPIVCDNELVDPEFGTGAVKITPAHDFNDFECGRRHNLEMIAVFNREGRAVVQGNDTSTDAVWGDLDTRSSYETTSSTTVDRYEARDRVIERLKELDLYVGADAHEMQLPLCERSHDVLEPMLLPQWFVKCEKLAQTALQLAENGQMRIHPDRYRIIWKRWLENIHDWCISRQLWWGHQIPAYRVVLESPTTAEHPPANEEEIWIVAHSLEEAREKFRSEYPQFKSRTYKLVQDEDVLDTWFSSGLYPIAGLGWPNEDSADLKELYPLSLLETGEDILFFWAARMVMLCSYLYHPNQQQKLDSGEKLDPVPPFTDLYLHSMVRDAQGRKMSKSLGNVIDPVDMKHGKSLDALRADVENNTNISANEVKKALRSVQKQFPEGIPECGTDAMRFTLMQYMHQGRSINLDINKALSNRHFCNKMWQAARFILKHLDGFQPMPEFKVDTQTIADEQQSVDEATRLGAPPSLPAGFCGQHNQWILSELSDTLSNFHAQMDKYLFGEAVNGLHDFFLHKFCDVYLEVSKRLVSDVDSSNNDELVRQSTLWTLRVVLDLYLRAVHPFLPFITDELWHELNPNLSQDMSILSSFIPYQMQEYMNTDAREAMEAYMDVAQQIRSSKAILVEPADLKRTPVTVQIKTTDLREMWSRDEIKNYLQDLTNTDSVQIKFCSEQEAASTKDEGTQQYATIIVSPHISIRLPFSEKKVSKSIQKLQKDLKSLRKAIEKHTARMDSEKYVRTPMKIQEKDRETLENWTTQETALVDELRKLEDIAASR